MQSGHLQLRHFFLQAYHTTLGERAVQMGMDGFREGGIKRMRTYWIGQNGRMIFKTILATPYDGGNPRRREREGGIDGGREGERERGRERERGMERKEESERKGERGRKRGRDRDTEGERVGERHGERERKKERKQERDRVSWRER